MVVYVILYRTRRDNTTLQPMITEEPRIAQFSNRSPESPTRSPWGRLPAEVKCSIFFKLGLPEKTALAATSKDSWSLFRAHPKAPWAQSSFDAFWNRSGERARNMHLNEHLDAVRCRKQPIKVKSSDSIETIRHLADIVRGSKQRPRIAFHVERDIWKISLLPREFDLVLRGRLLNAERCGALLEVTSPARLLAIDLSGTYFPPGNREERNALFHLPKFRNIKVDECWLGRYHGLIVIPPGVRRLSYRRNQETFFDRALEFPSSMLALSLAGNRINLGSRNLLLSENLVSLDLSDNLLSTGIELLVLPKNLVSLNLHHNPLRKWAAQLVQPESLETLNLSRCCLRGGLGKIDFSSRLQTLDIRGNDLTDADLRNLSLPASVRVVALGQNDDLSGAAWIAFCKKYAAVTTLL